MFQPMEDIVKTGLEVTYIVAIVRKSDQLALNFVKVLEPWSTGLKSDIAHSQLAIAGENTGMKLTYESLGRI